MGDILWYLTAIGNKLNISIDTIIDKNIEKLTQ